MTYRFQWILDDIRNGLELPDRWPEDEAGDEETDDANEDETCAKTAHEERQGN